MTIDLIPATEQDRAFFYDVRIQSYGPMIRSMFGWDDALQKKFADKDFDERNIHIIINDGQRVGIAGWLYKDDCLWFGPFFILPKYQGLGVGTQFVKSIIEDAVSKKLPVKLQTLKKNMRAKSFYERVGFVVSSSSDVHWQMEYPAVL